MVDFRRVRETAKTGLISEHQLRLLIAQGKCPGIYAGNRFMVNYHALEEMLETQSRACMGEERE